MSVHELLTDLSRVGIRLKAEGDRLRYLPRSSATPEFIERMRRHKPALMDLLGEQASQTEVAPSSPLTDDLKEMQRLDEWVEVAAPDGGRSLRHPEYVDDDALGEVHGLPDPCPVCGSFEQWESMTGEWQCLMCDPPTASLAMLEHATRIRKQCGLAHPPEAIEALNRLRRLMSDRSKNGDGLTERATLADFDGEARSAIRTSVAERHRPQETLRRIRRVKQDARCLRRT